MTIWLLAQYVYAAVAWFLSARYVARTARFNGSIGRSLAATIRELRAAGRAADVARLSGIVEPSPVVALLELGADDVSPFELVAAAERVTADTAPPSRALRAMATVGTMLGLLAAIITMRAALAGGAPHVLELASTRAFDSAVVGFMTAVPCWTAIALCGRHARGTYADLERIVLALRADAKPDAPDGSDPLAR